MISRHKNAKRNHRYNRKNITILKNAYKLLCKSRSGMQIDYVKKSDLKRMEKAIQLVDIVIFNQLTNVRR